MEENKSNHISRRDILKGLATIPVLGYFGARFYAKFDHDKKSIGLSPEQLGISDHSESTSPVADEKVEGDVIRIGLIGNGMRGPQILQAMGYFGNEWVQKQIVNGKPSPYFQNLLDQDDLKIEITGVCDTFTGRASQAQEIVASEYRSGGAKPQIAPRIYATYREMLSDDQLDAIVILAPDHWHAKMAMDAARAGKHIYLEKPMCQTAEEAKQLRDVIRESGVIFQVGHQNRQQASYIKAREIVEKGLLGPISLVETYTNRNNEHGAWNRGIPEGANEQTVNWKEFLGDKPWREFDADMYFNWQKWFEYGTGPAGNQFTHEFDCINQILDLGIPQRVVATGGNYYYKDPRDIPDVFNAVFEYPDKGMALTYDCTLKNSKLRDKTFLGRDASMEVNVGVMVYPDSQSGKYKQSDETPIFQYHPKTAGVDAVTTATSKYYHDRGFGYTYHNGKRIDATYLHMKEWLQCIRTGKQPSCNIDRGFEETTTFYMSNLSYLEKRVVEWDPVNEKII